MDHINFMLLGLGNGAVFAALALALVVTYRSSGVLNCATGALSLQAAYTEFLERVLKPLTGSRGIDAIAAATLHRTDDGRCVQWARHVDDGTNE